MTNRFMGLVIEGDDEPAAPAPAPAAAAPKAAAAPAAAKTQRPPRQADAEPGFRQQGQAARADRPRGDRPQGDRPARRPQGDRPQGERPQGDRPRRVASEGAGDAEFPERRTERPRGGARAPRGASHSQVSRGKREFDRRTAPWKESDKSTEMALGKAEKTDDAEPATVGEVLLQGEDAEAAPAPVKVEDEEDAKLKTLDQYKQQLQTQKPAYELPAARSANEGQEIKGAVLLTREEEDELFARKEAAKKAAAPKERKVAQTIVVEPKPLLDSRRSEPRSEGRGGFRGGARGGRGGSAAPRSERPQGPRTTSAAPNLNDQTAFPSLK